jgi:S-adenosyl-L-methionine hydrolase (adenosine-forming)
MKTLTLLTDFGTQDAYVAMLKGVIATIAPQSRILDITHQVPPQDLSSARFLWMSAFPYFPPSSIHVAVVDPGVGSTRRAIAVQLPSGYLFAPDNGIVSGILSLETPIAAIVLDRPEYWRTPQPSHTFHGRDIFAPAAAHLANGVSFKELGQPIDWRSLIHLPIPQPTQLSQDAWQGCIQAIDHFGNLITNLRGDWVSGKMWGVELMDQAVTGHEIYANVRHHEAVAIVGSSGWIEIAVRNGNAAAVFGGTIGDHVKLVIV